MSAVLFSILVGIGLLARFIGFAGSSTSKADALILAVLITACYLVMADRARAEPHRAPH